MLIRTLVEPPQILQRKKRRTRKGCTGEHVKVKSEGVTKRGKRRVSEDGDDSGDGDYQPRKKKARKSFKRSSLAESQTMSSVETLRSSTTLDASTALDTSAAFDTSTALVTQPETYIQFVGSPESDDGCVVQ